MELTTIKLKGISPENILKFLEAADISGYVDKTLNKGQILDVSKSSIISRGHPIDKTFVKYFSAPLPGLAKLDKPPADFTYMKLPLYSFAKFRDAVEIFKNSGCEALDCEVDCQRDESKVYIAKSIRLVSGKIKIKLSASEIYVTPYLAADMWEKLAAIDSYMAKFTVSDKMIKTIVGANKINPDLTKTKKVPATVLTISDGAMTFSSKKEGDWSIGLGDDGEVEVNTEDTLELVIPLRSLEMMKGGNYEAYILHNKSFNQYLLVSVAGDDDKIANALLKYDKNVQ
jgi:hypothetical protein